MSEVNRYYPTAYGESDTSPTGEFVMFIDYATLREENERLKAELIRLKSVVDQIDNDLIDEALGSSGGE